jgi:hypothetical protein
MDPIGSVDTVTKIENTGATRNLTPGFRSIAVTINKNEKLNSMV